MIITLFPDRSAQSKQEHDLDWSEVKPWLDSLPIYSDKSEMPLIKLASFGDERSAKNCLRIDRNILQITGVECDYDAGELSIQEGYQLLAAAGVRCIIKTSARYTEDSPRWHVLAPLSKPVTRAERAAMVGKINTILGERLAPESFRDSQTFHIGALEGYAHAVWPIDGMPIDLLPIKPSFPIGLNTGVQDTVVRTEPLDFATDEQIGELVSAIDFINKSNAESWNAGNKEAYSYIDWAAMGNRLFNPDDERMYELFYRYSRASLRHYPPTMDQDQADAACDEVCREKWDNHLACDRTGFQAVFTQAQLFGWVNPRSRVEIDLTTVGFGQSGFVASNEREELSIFTDKIDATRWPFLDKKSNPIKCKVNLDYFLDTYSITCAYDVLKKKPIITIPNMKDAGDPNIIIQAIKQGLCLNDAPEGMVDNIGTLIKANPINPIKDWVTSAPWDGVDRLQAFCNTAMVAPDKVEYRNELMRIWMIQCVAAMDYARSSPIPNVLPKFESVLVFQGKQGLRKTKWIGSLLPKELRDYILSGATLDLNDKDSQLKAIRHWIVELGEVDATFRKSDHSKLKSFMSAMDDIIRLPYDREAVTFPRTTAFFASVNDKSFLIDDTGNRRFLALEVFAVTPLYETNIDLQQLWAQCWNLYIGGAEWWLNAELTNRQSEIESEFQADCPIEEMISNHFHLTNAPETGAFEFLNVTAILIRSGIANVTKAHTNKGAKILSKAGFKKRKDSIGNRGYDIKAKFI